MFEAINISRIYLSVNYSNKSNFKNDGDFSFLLNGKIFKIVSLNNKMKQKTLDFKYRQKNSKKLKPFNLDD